MCLLLLLNIVSVLARGGGKGGGGRGGSHGRSHSSSFRGSSGSHGHSSSHYSFSSVHVGSGTGGEEDSGNLIVFLIVLTVVIVFVCVTHLCSNQDSNEEDGKIFF